MSQIPKKTDFGRFLENHPLLLPSLAFRSGRIVFTTIGFVLQKPAIRLLGIALGILTDRRMAAAASVRATVLSIVSLFVFCGPYAAMPGFMLGGPTSIAISGSLHGGEPFSPVVVARASTLLFYYLVARTLLRIWPWRKVSTAPK